LPTWNLFSGDPFVLQLNWYTYVVTPGVCEDTPGIYEWHIEGLGSYIGQYGRIRRPTKEYGRNVTRLLNGQPYRLGKTGGFRMIHKELERAHRGGVKITLTILENVEPRAARSIRERELIAERGSKGDRVMTKPRARLHEMAWT